VLIYFTFEHLFPEGIPSAQIRPTSGTLLTLLLSGFDPTGIFQDYYQIIIESPIETVSVYSSMSLSEQSIKTAYEKYGVHKTDMTPS